MDQGADKNLEIFRLEYIDNIKEKISALALFEDTIIAGDENGVIKLYTLTTKNKQTQLEKGKEESVGKSRIENIICVESFKVAFILSGQSVYIYTVPELNNRTAKEKSDPVVRIVNNLHKDHLNEILVITKKKRIKFYTYKTEVYRLLEAPDKREKEFPISEIPDNLCLYDNWLYFSLSEKKKLCIINLNNMTENPQDIEASAIIHVRDNFLAFTGGIGLFMDKLEPSNKTPITFSPKPFVNFSYYKTYIIALHEGEVGVYDPEDPEPKQVLLLESSDFVSKYLLVNGSNIVVFTMKQIEKKLGEFRIWRIKELPFEAQISNMIKNNNFEEALNILNKNYNTNDPKKIEAIEEFYLECGWASLKKFNKEGYDLAKLYFHISEVNIYEVIYMYSSLLDIAPAHDEMKNVEAETLKNTQIEFLDEDPNKLYKDALNFLIDFLLDKRQFYMGTIDFSSKNLSMQAISFKIATNSLSLLNKASKEQKYSLIDTIRLINLTLVKAMAKVGNMKRCAEVIDTDYVNTDLISDGFLEKLNNEDSRMALAYVFEKQGNFSQALEIWREFGKDAHPKYRNPARDRSFKILHLFGNNQNYTQLFEDNIKWLFKIDKEQTFETLLSHEMLPIDYILSKIIPDLEKDKGVEKAYREQFLKFIDESSHRSEKYQTLYVDLLIDKLFQQHSPEQPKPPESPQLEKQYSDLFDQLAEMKLFNKNVILEKIKGKWMLDLELYLYVELANYNQALQRLLTIGKTEGNFKKVRAFCEKYIHKEINLFTELFKLLEEEYNKSDKEKTPNIYEEEMINLLRDFENNTILDLKDKTNREKTRKNKELVKLRRFEILNSTEIIKILPSHWKINNDVVYNYLNLVLRESAHLNNKYKLQKNIIKMDLVYRRSELCDLKNKSIEVHNETNCCGCGKKIANNIFVVYPNNKMYHSKCAGNPCIDPITNVDFSKKILNLNDLNFNES